MEECGHKQEDLLIDGCHVTCLRCGKTLDDLETPLFI
jgi:hypothetical protein